jgi:OH-DDVA oxygenase
VARITLGIWTTHGPQLNTTPEQWMLRVPADESRSHWYQGRLLAFEELVDLRRGERLDQEISLEARTDRHARCQSAIAELAAIWSRARPDVCVIFGNDQRELMLPDLQPAFTVYHGETFWNGPLSAHRSARLPPGIAEGEWANRPAERTEYRALPELAERLIAAGVEEGWDFAASNAWPEHGPDHHHVGTPHAFAFVIRRVMNDAAVPILPIITNTFFEPNQPRPWRCFELGRLVHRVIGDWKRDLRVAVIGSGGMTHFVINEEFDRQILDAVQARDETFMRKIDPVMMKDGTSELLNWVSASGCLFETDLGGKIIDYVPCYRTRAGSGTAQGFIAWT